MWANLQFCFRSICKIKSRKLRIFVFMANLLLKPTFGNAHSSHEAYEHKSSKLFIELGQRHLASFVVNSKTNQILAYEFFQLNDRLTPSLLNGYIVDKNFSFNAFEAVFFVHNQKEFALIPSDFHKNHLDKSILETIHGDLIPLQTLIDELPQWEIVNIFGIEKSIYTSILAILPEAKHIHINSIYLKSAFKQLVNMHDQWIKVYFYPSFFNVVVMKDAQLQIMQSFYYETADDVIYFLINLTDQFLLDVTTLHMQVSGLIEEGFITFKELNKYFLNVSLELNPELHFVKGQEPHEPLHYFTPLFLSSQCV